MNVKDPISIKEWQKHRSIQSWEIKPGYICFHAKCSHPAIEATIKEFCILIDKELISSKAVLSEITKYSKNNKKNYDHVNIPAKVDQSKIEPEKDVFGDPKYIFRNTQFILEKNQVIELLMGTRLYGKTDVPLRELVQNSIDACLVREALHDKWDIEYTPKVSIRFYSVDDDLVLEVEDNGIRMDQEIVDKFYSKVGCSYYKSPEFYELKVQTRAKFQPTSRFGIGILSCFMVTDEIHVETRRQTGPAESSAPLEINVQGYESIFYIKKGNRAVVGTLTKLFLKKDNPWSSTLSEQIIKELHELFPNPPFEIDVNIHGDKDKLSAVDFSRDLRAIDFPENWQEHENLRLIKIEILDKEIGIACNGYIGFLEHANKPMKQILTKEKEILIDMEQFNLKMSISMDENLIKDESASITLNSSGDIDATSSYITIAKSFCKLSLHGILVPTNLFPDFWTSRHQSVKFKFPFACDLKIDILYNRDLDLNSARNEIVNNEKWSDFYSTLCVLLCSEIKRQVSKNYWIGLKKIFSNISTEPSFKNALKAH